MYSDIVERASSFLKYKHMNSAEFERYSGLANGMFKKLSEKTRNQTFDRISKAFPELDINWLRTGEGEMLRHAYIISQEGDNGIRQQGLAGHDLNQTNNSEKLIEDFIKGVQHQNKVAEKAMEQTGKALDSINCALNEAAENRKLVERLISLIEKNNKE